MKRKTKKKPLVSVIMPVHNANGYLSQAIDSIVGQTYKNWELIIVDDASTDRSWWIIKRFKQLYPRKIKAIRLEKNLGKGGDPAGNVAFAKTRGEYIARMDADDVAREDRLARQVQFLNEHEWVGVVGSWAEVIDKEGEGVGEKKVETKHEEIYKAFFELHPVIHPTVMIRRSVLVNKEILYRIKYSANNDYLTFMEMISRGVRFANLEEKLLQYRIHGENDSLKNLKRTLINTLRIRWQAVREFGYSPELVSIGKMLAQTALVMLLPTRIIMPVYLMARGVIKPEDWLKQFTWRARVSFGQIAGLLVK